MKDELKWSGAAQLPMLPPTLVRSWRFWLEVALVVFGFGSAAYSFVVGLYGGFNLAHDNWHYALSAFSTLTGVVCLWINKRAWGRTFKSWRDEWANWQEFRRFCNEAKDEIETILHETRVIFDKLGDDEARKSFEKRMGEVTDRLNKKTRQIR